GVDRQTVQSRAKRRLRALVRVLAVSEQREQTRLAGDLGDERLEPRLGSGDAERCGDRGAADAALAEHDDELAASERHGMEACLELEAGARPRHERATRHASPRRGADGGVLVVPPRRRRVSTSAIPVETDGIVGNDGERPGLNWECGTLAVIADGRISK